MTKEAKLVDLVLCQMKAKKPDAEIRCALEASGFSPTDALDVIDCIRSGFRAGTLAVASAMNQPSGDNPLYTMAFKRGKAAMRFTAPGWVFLGMIWPYLLGACVLAGAILIWKTK